MREHPTASTPPIGARNTGAKGCRADLPQALRISSLQLKSSIENPGYSGCRGMQTWHVPGHRLRTMRTDVAGYSDLAGAAIPSDRLRSGHAVFQIQKKRSPRGYENLVTYSLDCLWRGIL